MELIIDVNAVQDQLQSHKILSSSKSAYIFVNSNEETVTGGFVKYKASQPLKLQ